MIYLSWKSPWAIFWITVSLQDNNTAHNLQKSVCICEHFRCSHIFELSRCNCCMVSTKKSFPYLVMMTVVFSWVCVSSLNNTIACLFWRHQRQLLLFSLPFYHVSIQPPTNRPRVQWTDAKHIVPVCLLTHMATLSFLTLLSFHSLIWNV